MNTSKVHINNMYIIYTFVHFVILLIRQVFGVVPLPVTVPLTIEALSLGFRFNLGFLHWSGNWLAIQEVPLLALALLETSGLVNHQHLMLLLDFYLHGLKHDEQLWDQLPLHVIVHHEALVAW